MLSVIIPTHNRVDSLVKTLDSVLACKLETPLEVVVVDNNSTDRTREEVASYAARFPGLVKYTHESRTAFTRARSAGAEQAKGDVLLYIDDDVLIVPGSFGHIESIFAARPDAGVLAGKIMPKFLRRPPFWVLRCQDSFNGWSLYEPFSRGNGDASVREVEWAAGPMMAVSRSAYDKVGGFPPDTIGVETNKGSRSFKKLYIGPGDGGLCRKVLEAGSKVYFSPDVACYHVIPPIRFTIKFWRSRMIGEGHYFAVCGHLFWNYSQERLEQERGQALALFRSNKDILATRIKRGDSPSVVKRLKRLVKSCMMRAPETARCCTVWDRFVSRCGEVMERASMKSFEGMYPEELWLYYYKSYLEADYFLEKYPELGPYLWKIAAEGVEDRDFDEVIAHLPEEYQSVFMDENAIFDDKPLDSIEGLARIALHSGVTETMSAARQERASVV